jgi:hypothetical protein
MGKKSGCGSGMKKPDHISESLKTIFWVKILKFFDVDLGSRMEKNSDPGPGSRIRDGKKSDPGSWINIPDPQYWLLARRILFFHYLSSRLWRK